VATVYWFARQADDFADEGERTPEQRLALLEAYRQDLHALQTGGPPGTAFFAELGDVIRRYELPFQPFHDLLDAFSQDVTKNRYADFAELLQYCRRSANPVGRLVLHLYGAADDPRNLECSDAICSALQLANLWQDIEIDFRKGRIYLPQEDMVRYGVTEAQISARDPGGAGPH
jgi:squalene synthase HpnC